MSLEITGKLIVKYDTQDVNERFRKREFVVEIADEVNGNVYTNFAKMQLVQAKCDILDRFNEGDNIKVSFNIKGNKWEKDGKVNYITNLDAWRIEYASNDGTGQQYSQSSNANNNSQPTPQGQSQNFYNPSPENLDDLPF